MAEDTYELRLEQEGFHIIPVQGGEVMKTIFNSSIKQSARSTCKEEWEDRLQSSCCHKEQAPRGWGSKSCPPTFSSLELVLLRRGRRKKGSW